MENSEAVWSDEQLSGARELMAPGPFASEEQTAALDEAVAVLERADRLDERATAALATLAGPAYVPIAPPMHVMGGFRADVHNWWFEWPDHYFVPGDSQERWLGLVNCPPSQRYAEGSAVPGFPYCVADPKTGHVMSWAQPPRSGTHSGVASAGVLVFHRPTTSLSVLTLAPGDRVDLPIGLLRQLGLGSQLRHRRAARRFARAHRVGVEPSDESVGTGDERSGRHAGFRHSRGDDDHRQRPVVRHEVGPRVYV